MKINDDYEEYIDYCTRHGIDPNNYDNYEDYQKAVIDKFPPNNYDGWDRYGKKNLLGELAQYFTDQTTDYIGTGSRPTPPKGDIVETDDVYKKKRGKQIRRSLNWQEKRSTGKVSPTKKQMIRSISHKTRAGIKLNKGERKLRQRGIALRANELMSRKKSPLPKSEAWARANREMRLPK